MSDTRPPLDVEASAAIEAFILHAKEEGIPWVVADRIGRRMMDAARAAAYQPTGPDDLAGLLAKMEKSVAGHEHDVAGRVVPCDLRETWNELRVTFTGVRSSEADGLRFTEKRHDGRALVHIDAALRRLDSDHPARADVAAAYRALTGDTDPKVEPEP